MTLAKASDWVVPGSIIREAINDSKKSTTHISLLTSDKIDVVVREGKKKIQLTFVTSQEMMKLRIMTLIQWMVVICQ